MDELNKRVVILMEQFCASKSVFAQQLGIGLPTIAHISSGRNKPGVDILQKILLTYPTINATWLMLGIGEMITTPKAGLNIEKELININNLIDNLNGVNHNTTKVMAYNKLLLDEILHLSELNSLLLKSQIDINQTQQNLKEELENLKSKVTDSI